MCGAVAKLTQWADRVIMDGCVDPTEDYANQIGKYIRQMPKKYRTSSDRDKYFSKKPKLFRKGTQKISKIFRTLKKISWGQSTKSLF